MSKLIQGIEHTNIKSDTVPINEGATAVIGLVGDCKSLDIDENELYLCRSEKDDAKFGKVGTIPESLKYIRQQQSSRGNSLVFVVPANNDYGTTPTTPQMIVGEVSATDKRTGLKLFEVAKSRYGDEPMINIAPYFSPLALVKSELQAICNRTEGMAYIDTPAGMTLNEALLSRAGTGQFANLDEGQMLYYPHFKVANPVYIDETQTPTVPQFINVPQSAFAAGLRARIDLELGWHWSASNQRIYGVEGLDTDLTFSLGDASSDVNMLNAVGITTAVPMFGRGMRSWGSYSCGFPGNTDVEAFEAVRRVRAIIKRAIDGACVQFIGRPFSQAVVSLIRNTVNDYFNNLIMRGILISGKCHYLPEKNPAENIAKGHLTFTNYIMPPPPLQKFTFEYQFDYNALTQIV